MKGATTLFLQPWDVSVPIGIIIYRYYSNIHTYLYVYYHIYIYIYICNYIYIYIYIHTYQRPLAGELRGVPRKGAWTSVDTWVLTCRTSRVKHNQTRCYLQPPFLGTPLVRSRAATLNPVPQFPPPGFSYLACLDLLHYRQVYSYYVSWTSDYSWVFTRWTSTLPVSHAFWSVRIRTTLRIAPSKTLGTLPLFRGNISLTSMKDLCTVSSPRDHYIYIERERVIILY